MPGLAACGRYHGARGGRPAHPGHRPELLTPGTMRNCPALYPGRTLDPPDTAQAASGTGARPMRDSHPVILGRDAELAVLSAAADAAEAGRGALVLGVGPGGDGQTHPPETACSPPQAARPPGL